MGVSLPSRAMQRRAFLRTTSAAALLPVAAACARTFRLGDDQMLAPPPVADPGRDPDGMWAAAIGYARWTPSPHNTQPWRVRVTSPREATVYYDPRRLLPTTDPTGAFTIAGLATFVDYLRVAAASRGYALHEDTPAAPLDFFASGPVPFAHLTAVQASAPPVTDPRLILHRMTSRLPYDGRIVDDASLDALRRIAADHGHELHWSHDEEMVRWTLELNRFTLFSDLEDETTRDELRRWMRYTDEDAVNSPDGLWSHCLRFPGWVMRGFFEDHARWTHGWRARMSRTLLMHGMRGTRTVAWWTGPFDTPRDWATAGRMLGQSWLELTRRGLQLHPFGSIITNARAHARWTARVGREVPGRSHWLLVRVGRSDAPPRSHRRALSQVMLTDEEVA